MLDLEILSVGSIFWALERIVYYGDQITYGANCWYFRAMCNFQSRISLSLSLSLSAAC